MFLLLQSPIDDLICQIPLPWFLKVQSCKKVKFLRFLIAITVSALHRTGTIPGPHIRRARGHDQMILIGCEPGWQPIKSVWSRSGLRRIYGLAKQYTDGHQQNACSGRVKYQMARCLLKGTYKGCLVEAQLARLNEFLSNFIRLFILILMVFKLWEQI